MAQLGQTHVQGRLLRDGMLACQCGACQMSNFAIDMEQSSRNKDNCGKNVENEIKLKH